jgi:hypothetical protein
MWCAVSNAVHCNKYGKRDDLHYTQSTRGKSLMTPVIARPPPPPLLHWAFHVNGVTAMLNGQPSAQGAKSKPTATKTSFGRYRDKSL